MTLHFFLKTIFLTTLILSAGLLTNAYGTTKAFSFLSPLSDSDNIKSPEFQSEQDVGEEKFRSIPTVPTPQNTFFYPGAEVISSTGNESTLLSSDSTDIVTDWYIRTVKAENMTATSIIRTRVNDNRLNVISASGVTQDIVVEITNDRPGTQIVIKTLHSSSDEV